MAPRFKSIAVLGACLLAAYLVGCTEDWDPEGLDEGLNTRASDAAVDSASPLDIAPESSESVSCTDFESPIPSETRDQLEMPPADLRNYRYCEVLPAYTLGDRICVEVYNTLSFNACPEEKWATLDAETLQEELEAEFVFLNGPR